MSDAKNRALILKIMDRFNLDPSAPFLPVNLRDLTSFVGMMNKLDGKSRSALFKVPARKTRYDDILAYFGGRTDEITRKLNANLAKIKKDLQDLELVAKGSVAAEVRALVVKERASDERTLLRLMRAIPPHWVDVTVEEAASHIAKAHLPNPYVAFLHNQQLLEAYHRVRQYFFECFAVQLGVLSTKLTEGPIPFRHAPEWDAGYLSLHRFRALRPARFQELLEQHPNLLTAFHRVIAYHWIRTVLSDFGGVSVEVALQSWAAVIAVSRTHSWWAV
jgi:hypothetical protein